MADDMDRPSRSVRDDTVSPGSQEVETPGEAGALVADPEDLVSENSLARQRAMRRAAPRGAGGLSSIARARLPTCLLRRRTATAGDGR